MTTTDFSTRRFVLNRVLAAFAIPAGLSLVAFGARWWWLLDLCTHFRAHYFAALLIATVICLIARRFKLAAAFGAFATLNLAFIAPLYFNDSHPAPNATQDSRLRVMTVNAFCANQDRELLSQFIAEASPDVLLVMEVNGGWAAALERLAEVYPHRLIESRQQDCFGIALLSKLPMKQLEVRDIGPAGVPSIYAEIVNRDGRSFHLLGSHPVPPTARAGRICVTFSLQNSANWRRRWTAR